MNPDRGLWLFWSMKDTEFLLMNQFVYYVLYIIIYIYMFKQSAFLDQQNFNAFDQVCGELRRSREAEHHCGRVGPVANRSSRFVISGFR